MQKRFMVVIGLLIVFSMLLTACGGGAATGGAAAGGAASSSAASSSAAAGGQPVTLQYWLWDASQLPAYQKCADAFMAKNPNTKVKITQKGWDDYWNGIQTGMVSGTAPDVFTDHLAKYPEFAAKEQLVDIQPYVDKDKIDTSVYLTGLADLWARDGKRFGLPKDWDTIAIAFNKDALKAAGVTEDELNNATWNAKDGGTFGQLIAKLTVDEAGNNGLSPNFDKSKVKQYGLIINGAGGNGGQTEWSWLSATTGFKAIDNLYATKYNYDDPRFTDTIQWIADNMKKGYIMPLEQVTSLGGGAAFEAGKGALNANGSWMIGELSSKSSSPVGFARLPKGEQGRRSMFNGLADSIWVGTKNKDQAWELVKFLASKECADIVGEAGVVFPAQQSGVDKALAAYKAKGLDVAAFTTQATEKDGTFLFPVTDHASEIQAILTPALQSVLLGKADAKTALTKANADINAVFK